MNSAKKQNGTKITLLGLVSLSSLTFKTKRRRRQAAASGLRRHRPHQQKVLAQNFTTNVKFFTSTFYLRLTFPLKMGEQEAKGEGRKKRTSERATTTLSACTVHAMYCTYQLNLPTYSMCRKDTTYPFSISSACLGRRVLEIPTTSTYFLRGRIPISYSIWTDFYE